jgi:hypothetical protein
MAERVRNESEAIEDVEERNIKTKKKKISGG